MTTTTNTGTGVTRYLQVYTVLSQALAEGSIGAGEALPSEPKLVREYGVSRTTVRRALARLAAEGSIVRRRGSGTFARGGNERLGTVRQLSKVLDDLRNLPSNTTARLLAFTTTPTPDVIRREWPDFGDTVLMIRRVRHVKSDPVAIVTTYVPDEIGKRLTARRLGNDSVLVALDKLGYHGVSANQEASAVPADPLTARHLGLGVGAPVLNIKRLVRDSNGHVIAYSNYLYRPDRYEAHIVIDRDSSRRGHATRRRP